MGYPSHDGALSAKIDSLDNLIGGIPQVLFLKSAEVGQHHTHQQPADEQDRENFE
jgi:hypothetical protein